MQKVETYVVAKEFASKQFAKSDSEGGGEDTEMEARHYDGELEQIGQNPGNAMILAVSPCDKLINNMV